MTHALEKGHESGQMQTEDTLRPERLVRDARLRRVGRSTVLPRRAGQSGRYGLGAAPEDDAQYQRAPAVPRGHGADMGAPIGRRDAEDLVPGNRATDVEHDDALAAVGKAAHRGRPAVLPVAAGHAVLVLEARVPVVSLGPGCGEARESGEGEGAEFATHGASVASGGKPWTRDVRFWWTGEGTNCRRRTTSSSPRLFLRLGRRLRLARDRSASRSSPVRRAASLRLRHGSSSAMFRLPRG